ncbi:MAG: hypothetical protein WDA03_02225 [Trueperaceae bacterium]
MTKSPGYCTRKVPLYRPLRALLLLAALGLGGGAFAHATLVIGDLELTPDPPVAGEPVTVRISLVDPLLVAVEKALVRVEFREIDPEDPLVPASITGTEATEFLELPTVLGTEYLPEVDDGVYVGTFEAPAPGRYTVSVRDTTFRNEEAIANIGVDVGGIGIGGIGIGGADIGNANGVISFVLPPTPLAPRSLGTWLLWILGIPLGVGLLVTIFALRKAPAAAVEPGSGTAGE